MRFSVALIIVMIVASGCGPSERERFEATEKLLSAWDKETIQPRANYIRLLISEGADVNEKDKEGRTPLMLAYSDKHPEVLTLLIDAGADVNAKNNDGYTPLSLACIRSPAESVALLIDAGADVNAKDNDGDTPLIRAILFDRSAEFVALLIDAGADINAKNNDGNTPLYYCDDEKTKKLLKAAGATE